MTTKATPHNKYVEFICSSLRELNVDPLLFWLTVALDNQSKTFTADYMDARTGWNGRLTAGAPQLAGHLHRASIEDCDLGLGLAGLSYQILKVLQWTGVKRLHAFADDKPQEAGAHQ
jgi:hypothetical protein